MRVSVDGAEIELVAPKHRALVAILAAEANTVVSAERLIDELWGVDAPPGARGSLQSYVSVLRKKCREAGLGDRKLIETRQPGYCMRLADHEFDVTEFCHLVRAAREHLAGGKPPPDLGRAIDLVDEPVLADLDHLDTIRAFVADVHENHQWAVEQQLEIELEQGRASSVVPQLRQLVEQHPLQERMWTLLMRALYLAGRQADALRAFQDLRTTLIEALGVEPSPETCEVERQILEGTLAGGPAPVDVVGRPREPVAVPFASTSLFGRISEQADLEQALTSRRMVTLVGPGGCGKTRLAAEVARSTAGYFEEVAWIELNPLAAGSAIDEAVAGGLGLVPRQHDGLLDLVASELADRSTLIVLDNCEHVIESAALVVERLLAACPNLSILVTSREHLLVNAEFTFALPPLRSATPLELMRSSLDKPSEAAEMFMDRASLQPDHDQLRVIEAICAQLDGIPLAIELAAPFVSTMSVDELADRLLDRFRLFDERRGVRPQHRTMRAVVEWSYDLLDVDERRTFDALAVFSGSFTMEAAEDVAAAVGTDARQVVPRLVRKSMVDADTSGLTRYRLLDTLQAFGIEALAKSGCITEVRRAFVDHYTAVAVEWGKQAQLVTVTEWFENLGPDIPNFQAAMPLAREHDIDRALLMVDAFQWYFNYLGQIAETRVWLHKVIAEHELTLEQRAMARVSQASLANFAGDYGVTTTLAEEALTAAREWGDPRRINAALIMRGTTAALEGNATRAAECLIESTELSEQLGDLGGIAASMVFWGIAHRREGQYADAERCFDRALDGFAKLADDRGVGLVLGNMGRLAQQQGNMERAEELTRRALTVAARSLDPMVSAQVGLFAGHTQLDLGNIEQSMADFEHSLRCSLSLGNRTMSSAAIEWMVIIGGGQAEPVAVIDSFTRKHRNSPGTASARVEWDQAVAQAQDALSTDEHAAATARGHAMSLDQAVGYARSAAAVG